MKVEIDENVVPEGFEAIGFGLPKCGDMFINANGVIAVCKTNVNHLGPRLKIKEKEPKYRPLQKQELYDLVGKKIQHKKADLVSIVSEVDLGINQVFVGKRSEDAYTLLENWEYLDGSPIGKSVT